MTVNEVREWNETDQGADENGPFHDVRFAGRAVSPTLVGVRGAHRVTDGRIRTVPQDSTSGAAFGLALVIGIDFVEQVNLAGNALCQTNVNSRMDPPRFIGYWICAASCHVTELA